MLAEDTIATPVGVTLDRFIKRNQENFEQATGELSQLLRDIALAAKIVNRDVNRAGLADITGAFGTENFHGERQQRLDINAHVRFVRALRNGGEVAAIVSEEEDNIIYTGNNGGNYVVAIDPLDGSSNIDVNVSIGSIFSIYRRTSPTNTLVVAADFMQGGSRQVAAGYVLYSTSTMLVYTTGCGVNGFTYEQSLGEFFLSHPRITIPRTGTIYSCNEGNFRDFSKPVQQYLNRCHELHYTARYIGSLVADFHRNLFKGGIYLYPDLISAPAGKLRLLYECYPLAFLIEQAGGQATDGQTCLLDIPLLTLHQRSPFYIGSSEMINDLLDCLKPKETMDLRSHPVSNGY